jgi:hypothetical protein
MPFEYEWKWVKEAHCIILYVAATKKLPVLALSYKAVYSIQATKQFHNDSPQCARGLTVSLSLEGNVWDAKVKNRLKYLDSRPTRSMQSSAVKRTVVAVLHCMG